jgi:ELWxxDGT repeat protein
MPRSLLAAALLSSNCGVDASLPSAQPTGTGPTPFAPGNPESAGPYLVRDIRPGAGSSMDDPYAGDFHPLQGRVLFVANDGTHGLELWETNGTVAGTRLMADICPGACSSNPISFVSTGNTVIFQASDEVHGQELWTSDGTITGTRLVLDIRPGADSGAPTMFVPLGDKILIDVLGAEYSHELWTTDGTAGGTRFVREISPARATAAQGPWVASGGLVFFAVNDGAVGNELWATNGTAEGTRLVKDICPGPCDGMFALEGTAVGGLLYFSASSGIGPRQLWRSDGTPDGTRSLGVLFPGVPRAATLRNLLLFAAGRDLGPYELWKSGGQLRDTLRVSSVSPLILFPWRERVVATGEEPAYGQELWVTDGTPDGTVLVADINPGAAYSSPSDFVAHGDRLFFAATDTSHGRELWETDGTTEGTRLIADIRAGSDSGLSFASNARLFKRVCSFGDRIFFTASDGLSGDELWAFRRR